jgi:hypothetical protein
MPWKECNHMDERLRLVAKLLDGEKMAAVWESESESEARYMSARPPDLRSVKFSFLDEIS